MITALFAATLLGETPPPPVPARALYEACAIYVATQNARAAAGDGPERGLVCEIEAASQLVTLAVEAVEGGTPEVCLPDGVAEAPDAALKLARIFQAYVDRTAEAREAPDGGAVFRRALAGEWPCPR